jgi:hypothetical protein
VRDRRGSALARVAGPAVGFGPRRGTARTREQRAAGKGEATRAVVKELGFRAESEEQRYSPFSFSFSIISKHFQMILNPNLNLNQTTPTKNSNATS